MKCADCHHLTTKSIALIVVNACLKCSARGSLKIQDAKMTPIINICAPSHILVGLYLLRNQGMYRQSEKNLLNSNMSSTCLHDMVNFGPLTSAIRWRLLGTPANFNGFCVLASLVQRRRSPEANQTLHDVWPPPGLLYYIYTFGGSCPLTEFCPVQNSLYVQVLRSRILAALLHGTPAAGVSQTLRRGARLID